MINRSNIYFQSVNATVGSLYVKNGIQPMAIGVKVPKSTTPNTRSSITFYPIDCCCPTREIPSLKLSEDNSYILPWKEDEEYEYYNYINYNTSGTDGSTLVYLSGNELNMYLYTSDSNNDGLHIGEVYGLDLVTPPTITTPNIVVLNADTDANTTSIRYLVGNLGLYGETKPLPATLYLCRICCPPKKHGQSAFVA